MCININKTKPRFAESAGPTVLPGRAGRSPTFQDPDTPLEGLADTLVLASPIDKELTAEPIGDNRYSDIEKKCRYADIADADINIGTPLPFCYLSSFIPMPMLGLKVVLD